jgi:predicted Zn-dependent peptidase
MHADRRLAPQAQRTVLPNGARVLTERLGHVDSVSLGVWIAAGSKDEPPGCEGITHLIEHMLFKGTTTRSALEIAEASDDIGGNVNGFTDREFTYLYARTIGEQVETALELLFDLLLNSLCAEDHLALEKQLVLQEIRHVEDAPEDWVNELLLETAWPAHPLGRPLMGRPDTVQGIGRQALVEYLSGLLCADRIFVAAAGRVEHEQVAGVVDRLAGELRAGPPLTTEGSPLFESKRVLLPRPTGQVHFCLAVPGCARTDPARHALAVLDAILGGSTSSRLFQQIRENRGLAYSVGSYVQSYGSGGIFTIDAGTAPESFDLVLGLIEEEVQRLRAEGPSGEELQRARTQFKVAMALACESTGFRMQHLAGSEIYWGRVVSLDEIAAGVDAVTAEDVHRLAQDIFTPERQALVAIGPFDT